MSSPDDKGQAEIPADTQGEGKIRLDGSYLADALRACGGMVELKLVNSSSPMLFTSPDYELVVMPMFAGESQKPKGETEPATAEASQPTETTEPVEATAEAEPAETVAEKANAVAEAEAIAKAQKPKHKAKRKAKEPVAVA